MSSNYCFWKGTKGKSCTVIEGQRKCGPCLEIGRLQDREQELEGKLEQQREKDGE